MAKSLKSIFVERAELLIQQVKGEGIQSQWNSLTDRINLKILNPSEIFLFSMEP
jgi:hypothetical protein